MTFLSRKNVYSDKFVSIVIKIIKCNLSGVNNKKKVGIQLKSRAAVAFKREPLQIVEIDVEEPKAKEVLVKILYTSVCHTDAFTLSGDDPEGVFPAVLGHEGAGVVVSVGDEVTSVKHGIMLFHYIHLNVENVNSVVLVKQTYVVLYEKHKVKV